MMKQLNNPITSRENRWLKRFRAALRAGQPDSEGCVGLEGPRLVEVALRSGLEVAAVLVSASGERHLAALSPLVPGAAPLLRTSDRLFAGVADTRTPQGIAALVRAPAATFDHLLRGGVPLVIALVEVQDPGNVGTIVRSAEAFGATGVVACRGTAHPLAPKALRASAGSALRVPMLVGVAAPVVMAQLRMAGVKLCAASLSAGAPPAQTDLRGPVALFIGNEGAGLPPEVARSADARLRIPMTARRGSSREGGITTDGMDSLNAAVAASVLLYEAARQRGNI